VTGQIHKSFAPARERPANALRHEADLFGTERGTPAVDFDDSLAGDADERQVDLTVDVMGDGVARAEKEKVQVEIIARA
jgi:hypothetical protein